MEAEQEDRYQLRNNPQLREILQVELKMINEEKKKMACENKN